MKKLALIAATLICFAGCARNDTGEMTEDTSGSSTAVGTPATTQSESAISADTNASSSTLNLDTNNVGQPASPQSSSESSTPPAPPSPAQQPQPPQQGQQPQP